MVLTSLEFENHNISKKPTATRSGIPECVYIRNNAKKSAVSKSYAKDDKHPESLSMIAFPR